MSLHELTFAGLDALRPRVLKFRIAVIATLLKPSPATHATTALSRFLVDATLSASDSGRVRCD